MMHVLAWSIVGANVFMIGALFGRWFERRDRRLESERRSREHVERLAALCGMTVEEFNEDDEWLNAPLTAAEQQAVDEAEADPGSAIPWEPSLSPGEGSEGTKKP